MNTLEDFLTKLKGQQYSVRLSEDASIGLLTHYCAPYTGSDNYVFPAGTTFTITGMMRDDALYMSPDFISEELENKILDRINQRQPELADRLTGFSCYITEEQIENGNISVFNNTKKELLEGLKEYQKRFPDPWHRDNNTRT